jgi:GNAT superfamily N-acetyltransferase
MPGEQGNGLGSRLIQPVLEICDRDGIPAYLESSKRSNIAFYARHGFRVTAELKLARRGPTMWPMWREPRGTPSSPPDTNPARPGSLPGIHLR